MNAGKLDKTIEEIENQSEKLKSITKVYEELGKLQEEVAAGVESYEEIANSLNNIKSEIENSIKNQSDFWDKLRNDVVDFNKGYNKQIELLREENKSLYNSLENIVSSKLEKHKSDIQVEIRNEGMQIERGFKNAIDEKFISLETSLNKKFSKNNIFTVIGIITSLIILVLLILMMIK